MVAPMRRRNTPKPPLKFPIWKEQDENVVADIPALKKMLEQTSHSEEEMRRLMGHGFHLIQDALDGKIISRYDAQMVEWGIDDSELDPGHMLWKAPSAVDESKS